MSDEMTGMSVPETPQPVPVAAPVTPTATARRRHVEVPRWVAGALATMVLFAGGFGIARATADDHTRSEQISRTSEAGNGNTRSGTSNGGGFGSGNGNRGGTSLPGNQGGSATPGSASGSGGGAPPHTRSGGS